MEESNKTPFRFRLTSSSRAVGLLHLDTCDTSLELPTGQTLYVVARNGSNLKSATKLHFEVGGYATEVDAQASGERLRTRLRLLNAILALGLDVPINDSNSGGVSAHLKEEMHQNHGITLMDNVRGLLVFPDDAKHAESVAHVAAEVRPSDSRYWLDGLRQLWDAEIEFDERAEDALALLNMATLESSLRSSFLVTYLALERLIPTRRRSALSLALIDRLKNLVVRASKRRRSPVDSTDGEALLGSIGRLEYESVGSAFARLAASNQNAQIEGKPIATFIKDCTIARHKTAHPGKHTSPPDYTRLTRGLRRLTVDLLWSKHRIKALSIARPSDQITIPKGSLEIRTIAYPRR